MVSPATALGYAATGADILSKLTSTFGGGDKSAHKSFEASDIAWNRQQKLLKNEISWRVYDAKKAGIHPLYALGHSGSAPPAMALIPGQSEGGSNVARGLAATAGSVRDALDRKSAQAAQDRMLGVAELEARAQATRDFAAAELAATRSAKLKQEANYGGAGRAAATEIIKDPKHGIYESRAPEVSKAKPGNPSRSAGPPSPGSREYSIGGVTILGPYTADGAFPEGDQWLTWLGAQGVAFQEKQMQRLLKAAQSGSKKAAAIIRRVQVIKSSGNRTRGQRKHGRR